MGGNEVAHHEMVRVGWGVGLAMWGWCGRHWSGWRWRDNPHHFVVLNELGNRSVGATSWLPTANGHSRFAAQSERAIAASRHRVNVTAVGGRTGHCVPGSNGYLRGRIISSR